MVGCSSADKFSFVEYSRNPSQYDAPGAAPRWGATDQQALQFSSNVARLLRAKATGARMTRDVSNSLQVSMAALAGANSAFGFSDRSLAVLGLGSALIPDVQGIFNAQGRGDAYLDAVRLIETAQGAYMAHNQQPSATELTQNGATLIQRTQASVHVVEKVLSGRVPTIVDLEQATEAMSDVGAFETNPGPAFNHIEPTGLGPTVEAQAVAKAVAQAVAGIERRVPVTGEPSNVQPLTPTKFQKEVGALTNKMGHSTDAWVDGVYSKLHPQAGPLPPGKSKRDHIYEELSALRNTKPQADGLMGNEAMDQLERFRKAFDL